MHIIDFEGNSIEVNNLDKAIEQADAFRTYSHTDPAFAAMDKNLQAYWQDVYDKLIKLKETEAGL